MVDASPMGRRISGKTGDSPRFGCDGSYTSGSESDIYFVGNGDAAKNCKEINSMFWSLYYSTLEVPEANFGGGRTGPRENT